jgi:hypothetical protein
MFRPQEKEQIQIGYGKLALSHFKLPIKTKELLDYSSIQILSRSFTAFVWTALFNSNHTFSLGFKTGD